MEQKRNWIVTGVSRGLGLEIAKLALQRGDRVLGTTRDGTAPNILADHELFSIAAMDMSKDDVGAYNQLVQIAQDNMGSVDVLVNNAGYAVVGPTESASWDSVKDQFQVNYLAPLGLIRAVLPIMRQQGSGHVINISSTAAITPSAGSALYSASKAALSTLSVALAMELEPFGVRMSVIEPGSFRTEFLSEQSLRQAEHPIADYANTTGGFYDRLRGISGQQGGDPERAAQVICDLVEMDNPPRRLTLGSDAVGYATIMLEAQLAEMQGLRELSISTDYQMGIA